MEVLSLCSPPCASRLRSGSWRKAFLEKSTGRSLLLLRKPSTSIGDGNLRSLDFPTRTSSGPTKAAASSNANTEVSKRETSSKDKDLAFVAGATGRVGSRLVRELLKLGFRVRAGVRSVQRAEALVESVRQMKLDDGTGTSGTEPFRPATEKLEIVECDLEKQGGIAPAIGNASVVLCCIGASEKEISDVTGPYRIDYKATENLIKAATDAKVDHFILLTSLGTNKIGFPAAILNLFWGVLIWKRKAEEALIASGLPYTIVRPGGMERPTDSFKETHNLVLANEDTRFGGLVSNLQVAELMACMAKNKKLSYCKVVEVIAETTAPLLTMEELLAEIPSKREPPAEIVLTPSSTESRPTAPAVEEKPEKTQVQKTRPLSPYYMYDNLKPPSSPTPTPSATPGSSNEKKAELVQAETAPAPKSTESSSKLSDDAAKEKASNIFAQKTRPLSPYTAYENLKPPSSPSPNPSIASTGTTESAVNVVPVTQNGPATENTVSPDVPESREVTNSNSSYRSPFPVYGYRWHYLVKLTFGVLNC